MKQEQKTSDYDDVVIEPDEIENAHDVIDQMSFPRDDGDDDNKSRPFDSPKTSQGKYNPTLILTENTKHRHDE